MKILHPDLSGSTGVKSGKNARGAEGVKSKSSESAQPATSKGGDRVDISSVGYQMKTFEAGYKEASSIRGAKVDEMRDKIANGYNPPAEDVADAIIRTVSSL